MKGNNQLSVNLATMNQIVQEWVNLNVKDKPTVTSIRWNSNNNWFEIALQESEPVKLDASTPPA